MGGDIGKPATPLKVDSLSFDARILNDVSVSADGTFGIVTREGASNRKNGIVVLDTSDPAHPKVLSEYRRRCRAACTVPTSTAGTCTHRRCDGIAAGHQPGRSQGAEGSGALGDREPAGQTVQQPRRETFTGGQYLHDVQVKDGLLYAGYWRDGLVILDVGNGLKGGSGGAQAREPAPVQLPRAMRAGLACGAHAVFRYKNYVFVGDEVFPAIFDLTARDRIPVQGIVHVVDVSDIEHPRKVAQYAVPEGGSHNMWVQDDVLHGVLQRRRARAGRVRRAARRPVPAGREIARLWTGDPKGYRPNQPFTWGAQPHQGLIYFNDINSGVWITRLKKDEPKAATTTSP